MLDVSKILPHASSNFELSPQNETPAHQRSAVAPVNVETLVDKLEKEISEVKNNDSKTSLSKEEYIKASSLKIWNKLEAERKSYEKNTTELKTARFPAIPTEPTTMVTASDGTQLPFNVVSCVGNKKFGIVGQYPTLETLASYSRMLVDHKPATLIILSPAEEITSDNLPDYFSSNHTYRNPDKNYDVELSVKKEKTSNDIYPENSDFDLYTNNIKVSNGESVEVSVIHFKIWHDYSSLTVDKLDKLVNLITNLRDKNIEKDNKKELLVIHCLAGVDRSGVLLAAIAIHDDPTRQSNLRAIINNMRATRNSFMVSYETQLRSLVEYCIEKGYPLDDANESQHAAGLNRA